MGSRLSRALHLFPLTLPGDFCGRLWIWGLGCPLPFPWPAACATPRHCVSAPAGICMRALASAFEQLELAAGSLARAVQRRPTLGFLVLLPLFGSGRRPAQTLSSRLSLPTACTFVPPSPLPSDTAVSLEPGARALLQGGSVEPAPAIWSSAALGFSITSPTSRPTWAVFWPRPVHINLLETACIYRLLCLPARRGDLAKCFCVLCDSNDARCSVQKGRSPSAALARGLKRIAAVAFTFGFFAKCPSARLG